MSRSISTPARPELLIDAAFDQMALFRNDIEYRYFYNVIVELAFAPLHMAARSFRYPIPEDKLPLPHRQNYLFDLAYDLHRFGCIELTHMPSK